MQKKYPIYFVFSSFIRIFAPANGMFRYALDL